MGSGTSKDSAAAPDPSPSSSGGPCRLRSRVFGASCFGFPSTTPRDVDDGYEEEENGSTKGGSARGDEIGVKSTAEINGRSRKLSTSRQRKMPPLGLRDADRSGEHQGSSSAGASISLNPSSRSKSRFGLIADRIGFRLNRAASLGSSRAQSLHLQSGPVLERDCVDVDSRNEDVENANIGTNPSQDVVHDHGVVGSVGGHSSHMIRAEAGTSESRRYSRRIGPQEPLEGSVRFSRTLSVGRLRDRVLRRTSSSAGMIGTALLDERSPMGSVTERQALSGRRRLPPFSGNEIWPEYARNHPYHVATLTDSSYDSENGSSQLREGSNHDLLESRSAFHERRRRIRSQVRALQRLGSRFENLSGHERSCILSGQHRAGRCTCRASNRVANPNDEAGTRASISRIVMLAEALFEVLDEIHQQSAALSSRPSFSSIGSVPAPKEVVERMPVKMYMKPPKHQNEEAAQCYICLVEYEDGDFMRILPCNHEFHQTCIDKWLKEIHRVCPLCRGDVCRSEASGTDKTS